MKRIAFHIVLGYLVWTAAWASAAGADTVAVQPRALEGVNITQLKANESELTGSGVKLAVICRSLTYLQGVPQNDYKPAVEHNCFEEGRFNFYHNTHSEVGVSAHSTACCSILFGSDANAYHPQLGAFRYSGIVPGADVEVFEFWYFLAQHVFTQDAPPVDVISASFGSPAPSWWTRGIQALAEKTSAVVVSSIGNGTGASESVLFPGASANVIGVGVVSSVNSPDLSERLTQFPVVQPGSSTAGPSLDKRCKPDIVAPGNCLAAEANTIDGYQPTGDFSSFSTPVVAGAAALLLDKAKSEPNLVFLADHKQKSCLIKALLLNSARKLPYWHKGKITLQDDHEAALDYLQGAGMLDALGAYGQLIAGRQEPGDCGLSGWDINRLGQNGDVENVYRLDIDRPSGLYITATVVWNRHFGEKYPFDPVAELDNDFALELWKVDKNQQAECQLLDYSDSNSDNVEHIHFQLDGNCTSCELVVAYSDSGEASGVVPPAQPYAIAWDVRPIAAVETECLLDLNGDGAVDRGDFAAWMENYLRYQRNPDSYCLGDINADGEIDLKDLKIIAEYLGL